MPECSAEPFSILNDFTVEFHQQTQKLSLKPITSIEVSQDSTWLWERTALFIQGQLYFAILNFRELGEFLERFLQ